MLRRAITQIARATAPARGYGVRFASINGTALFATPRALRPCNFRRLNRWNRCATGNQVRTGMALEIDGKIYRVGKNQHVKPGKGGAYVQVR